MKKFLLFSTIAIASVCLASFYYIDELPIGASIPNATIKMKDISGKELSLNDARMKNGLLVMFSCNSCPYVIRNQERTRQIGDYVRDKGVGYILINSNEAQRDGDDAFENMQAYARDQKYNWYYVVDEGSKMADAFGARRTPECFLFDQEGKLVYHGAIDDNPTNAAAVSRNHLKEAINEMLAGKEVTVKTSRSVGCAIKRKA